MWLELRSLGVGRIIAARRISGATIETPTVEGWRRALPGGTRGGGRVDGETWAEAERRVEVASSPPEAGTSANKVTQKPSRTSGGGRVS